MSKLTLEDFQKAIDQIESQQRLYEQRCKELALENRYFCYNEEQKEIIKKFVPNADIVMIPQTFKADGATEDTVYVIPYNSMGIKPVKFCIEDKS